MASVFRAIFGYLFLILMVRVVGRRPGKQITPFEFILIFFLGGLTLTGMVGDEVSLSSAFCQIITVACCHYAIVWMRTKSSRLARIFDGTPLRLIDDGQYRVRTMQQMRVQEADLMAMARDQGMKGIEEIGMATLERNGEISLVPKKQK
jgi:uncharacterized membrane protein YcaP (DUF421 family)